MNKFFYFSCSFFLFLGLLWIFLPHAYHNSISNEEETSHLFHVLQGAIIAVVSLIILISEEKEERVYVTKEKVK